MLGSNEKLVVKKTAAELIQGMMKGMDVGTFNFEALLICIYEADQDAELILAVTQIEQEAWADKSIEEGIAGAVFAYAAYQSFMTQVLPACSQVDRKDMNLTKVNAVTNDLWGYNTRLHVEGDNVIFNGENITENFHTAFDELDNEEYYNFGEKMGATLANAATGNAVNQFLY